MKVVLVFLSFSFHLLGNSNHILILGGGGEPGNEETIFDNSLRTILKYSNKNPGWNKSISFDGNHRKTKEIIQSSIPNSQNQNSSFTEANFREKIAEYKRKIQNGEIKSGDQMMLFLATHGAKTRDGEKTHSVSTSSGEIVNNETLEGATLVSMDELQELTKLAEEKNIRLAILDFSCHSGNSTKLSNSKTCVITSSGPNHYGYASFGDDFSKNMNNSKNLEEVFLKTFVNRGDPSFPMISTEVGLKLNEKFYELMTPYLYYSALGHGENKLKNMFEKNECSLSNDNLHKTYELCG